VCLEFELGCTLLLENDVFEVLEVAQRSEGVLQVLVVEGSAGDCLLEIIYERVDVKVWVGLTHCGQDFIFYLGYLFFVICCLAEGILICI